MKTIANYKSIILLICLAGVFTFVSIKSSNPQKLIWSDMEGYYVYLPAFFIHGGFDHFQVKDTAYLRPWEGTSKIFTKYTCGVALLEAPFFLSAHLMSGLLGYDSSGYSDIYCYGLILAAFFYLVFGMYLLWSVLRKVYTKAISILSLAGLFFGTNLYYYSLFQASMSHVYSFFLFALLVWFTDRYILHTDTNAMRKSWFWCAFGLLAGVIVLVRPTNIIVLFYPLYQMYKVDYFKKENLRYLISFSWLAAICFLIIWIPQMLYWKNVTGSAFTWSYGNESFKYWQEPKLIRVLIDPWNGWLLYSPIAAFGLLGLLFKNLYNQHYNRMIIAILVCATWIFASWWAWWFGGAFGHRCYVEYYALLAVPFAQFATVAKSKKLSFVFFILLYGLCVYYSMGLTYNYSPPWDGPDWTYQSVLREIHRLF